MEKRQIDNAVVIKTGLLILACYCAFIITLPNYLYLPNYQIYIPPLDYSRFSPDKILAGGDMQLLINDTNNSPFTPALQLLINTLKSLLPFENYLVAQILYKLLIFSYLIIVILLLKHCRQNIFSLIVITLFLVSYPLIHEIERGQWNLLVIALAYAAILTAPARPLTAIALFTCAMQLKIYPLLFFPVIYKSLLSNRLRFTFTLILLNVSLLFISGTDVFMKFLHQQISNTFATTSGWGLNPSISSFVDIISHVFNLSSIGPIVVLLLKCFACIFVGYYLTYSRSPCEVQRCVAMLIIACLAVLTIPLSYDYRIVIIGFSHIIFTRSLFDRFINGYWQKNVYYAYMLSFVCILFLFLKNFRLSSMLSLIGLPEYFDAARIEATYQLTYSSTPFVLCILFCGVSVFLCIDSSKKCRS